MTPRHIDSHVSVAMGSSRSWRAIVPLLVSASLLVPLRQAHACDPNCDAVGFFILGTPAALGTILIAPLVGRAVDHKPGGRYWQALGLTALATGVGWGIGAAVTFPSGEQVEGTTSIIGLAALPVVLGTLATILVYRSAPRTRDMGSAVEPRVLPLLSYAPSSHRLSVGVTLRF
jgi:glucose uptake protein GlcU